MLVNQPHIVFAGKIYSLFKPDGLYVYDRNTYFFRQNETGPKNQKRI